MWALLAKQAEYSFNRGHAVAYSLLAYLTSWLKIFYPVEFLTAVLTAKSGNTAKLSVIINECHRLNIKVLPPKLMNQHLHLRLNQNQKKYFWIWSSKRHWRISHH